MGKIVSKIKNNAKMQKFFKSKKLYIVLTIFFSLILIADILVGVLVPSLSSGMDRMSGGRSQIESSGEMPDMSSDEMPDMSSDEMPDMSSGERPDMSSDEMPDISSGERPDMSSDEMPDMSSGERPDMSSDEMPDMSSDNMPDMGNMQSFENAGSQQMGILQLWKANWIIILIIFAILDAGSIFMLVRISKKEKLQNMPEMPELEQIDENNQEVHIERKPYKKKHSHYIWIIALVGMVLMIMVIKVLRMQSSTDVSQTEATVYTETAEVGEISSIVPGTGTLADEEAEALSLPSNIEITNWYVKNGDTVEEGDMLASVDTVSVMSAIVEVQEKMESLDEALEEHENDEIDDTLTAGADGRVKVIYAKKSESVVDTMYVSEALMLISLDGKMAVSLETDQNISAGDSVTVVLSDDSEISGKVESKTNGTVVVTASDKGTDYGEKVTVKTEDGTQIGSGKLYIHSELKVTGFTGTVSAINVSVDEEVSSGETLLTLTDTDYTGEYELLLEKRSALEEQIQKLFQIYKDKCVYAQCAGIVSGIENSTVENSAVSGKYTVEKLSEIVSGTENSGESDSNIEDTEEDSETEDSKTDNSDTKDDSVTEEDENTSNVSNTYQNYIGIVSSIENEIAKVSCFPNPVTDIGAYEEILALKNEMTAEKELVLSELTFVYKYVDGKWTSNASLQQGDVLVMTYSPEDNKIVFALCVTENTGASNGQDNAEMNGGQGDVPSSEGENSQMASGSSNSMSASASGMSEAQTVVSQMQEAEIESDYGVSVDTWLSITPQNYMEITITVDELDILSLEKEQTAEVTLNAFPGQAFEGTVTSINVSGSNSGGSTKYTAVVQIPREENMLAGMNASVKITIDTKENVVFIPVEALVEQEGNTYVYTSYNEKKDLLGDLVEVTTGVSDGNVVEIISGLSEGSTYCYSYLDVVNYTSSFTSGGTFSMGNLFGGNRSKSW